MNFLEGLKESLNYMGKKEIETAVLVPLFHKFSENKDFLNGEEEMLLSHIDIKSPSIDMIIAKLPSTETRKSDDVIRLYAFDLTTWDKPE